MAFPRIRTSIPPESGHCVLPLIHAEGKTATITWGMQLSSSLPADAQDAANACWQEFVDAFQPTLDSQVTVGPAELTWRAGTGGPLQLAVSGQTPVAGTDPSVSPPGSIGMGITKRTQFVGKKFRGRITIPWIIAEADVNEVGLISAAGVTDTQTRANAFLLGLDDPTSNQRMVLLHSYVSQATAGGPIIPDPEIPATPVISLVARTQVRHQRRRDLRPT